MAERTGLIAIHREMLVIEHRFAKQLDLLHLVIRRCGQPLESFCLDAIDIGLDLCNFLQGSGRKRYACLLRPHCSAAQRGKHGYGRSGNPGVHPARPRQQQRHSGNGSHSASEKLSNLIPLGKSADTI